jgi:hypothetical protein
LPNGGDCWTQTTGKFQHWQFWIDLPSSRIIGWLDNWSIFDSKIASTAIGFTNISLGQGASGVENGLTWFDDIYIASTQARVEACNAAEYSLCSRRILQYVVAENWQPGEIQLRLHNMRALRGEAIYLYVIDAQGRVSNGIPIARPVIKAN